jgi:hypothetical protein
MKSNDPIAAMAAILVNSPTGKAASDAVKKGGGGGEKGGGKGGGGPLSFLKKKKKAPKQGITKDRILREFGGELNQLWNESNPHVTNLNPQAFVLPGGNPQTDKVEQGCWIIYNDHTDTMRLTRFVMASTRASCAPGDPGLGGHEEVACFFHTHPNTGEEGYDGGPSPADVNFANIHNYPGLIRTQIGGHTWFGRHIPDQ